MDGKMIWFNPDKGFGFIRTGQDERLLVEASGFAEGHDPEARCGGRDVAFERIDGGTAPLAVGVRYVTVPEQRRARLRHAR
jgi:cold shock CspA family protein